MDISVEGIIIIRESKIVYLNDKFLEQQKNYIEEATVESSSL